MSDGHVIKNIAEGSIAEELEIKKGDILLSVNNRPIEDIFDYRFLINDEYVELEIKEAGGEICVYEIEKDAYEDIGLEFGSGLMDSYRSCTNKCIFCFIDQMPPGMRETLYFKDDDSRLSFLQGNYVTLTNMTEKDIHRIISYRMEPINISVHTTDPELRKMMLGNRFAGDVLKYIDTLYAAGIRMNGQIVLCKNINDGEHLEKTIADLSKYIPFMESVSVVPAGLTKFRDKLFELEHFNKDEAIKVIDSIEKWQKKIYNDAGVHFVHASDEFYLLAEREVPEEERYDGYLQLENGVGMMRSFSDEIDEAVAELARDRDKTRSLPETRNISVVTGALAAPMMEQAVDKYICTLEENNVIKKGAYDIKVFNITNRFFGDKITVSGLLTGRDIIEQLKGKPLGNELLLPVNMFRAGEEYLLDDVSKKDMEKAFNVKVVVVPDSGKDFIKALGGENHFDHKRQIYENDEL